MKFKKRGRPSLRRNVNINPRSTYFKPRAVPMAKLAVVQLTREEVEAVRLKNINHLDQYACAIRMRTSPSTLQRILARAYEKIADALVNGKAIEIIH